MRIFLLATATLALWTVSAHAELLPADRPIHEVIDHYIDAKLAESGVQPVHQADDATLIRRLTLDLNGRIPTAAEVHAFLESTDPEKRRRLVDRLMASPNFVAHQVNEFDVLLSGENPGSMREYLTRAFGEDRSWDQIFREVIVPDQQAESQKGAVEFLRRQVSDLDRATNMVSVTFFGVNVSCAQCHDHPLVEDWHQDHFFGMKAFLARTFDNGGFLAERNRGEVKFKTTAGEEKRADLMFLTGAKVADPTAEKEFTKEDEKKERDLFEQLKKEKKAPPEPEFSPRQKLVELALQPDESVFFSRSIVNRVWARLMGRGIVEPLDQMHSANRPSHPELLDWLARDMAAHNYDLRRLIAGIVMSQAYSRASRPESGDAPYPETFGMAQVRPLTPMQLSSSLRLAVSDPAKYSLERKPEDLDKEFDAVERGARGFANKIEQPHEDFEISAEESLLFSNSEQFERDFLTDGGDRLLHRLKSIEDVGEAVEMMVWNVYTRAPTEEEKKALTAYINDRADRREEVHRQVLWALLASSEFRFNH